MLSREHLAPMLLKHQTSAASLVQGYALLAGIITAAEIGAVVAADPDDNALIAAALAARAGLIVSGDHELLNLKSYRGIDIVNPAEALRRIVPE